MAAKTEVLVTTPTVPNFIKIGDSWVQICELSDDTLREVAGDWEAKLFERKRQQMKNKKA
jgi:hypothetical protein